MLTLHQRYVDLSSSPNVTDAGLCKTSRMLGCNNTYRHWILGCAIDRHSQLSFAHCGSILHTQRGVPDLASCTLIIAYFRHCCVCLGKFIINNNNTTMSSSATTPSYGGDTSGGTSLYPSGKDGDYGDYMPPSMPFDFSMPDDGPWVAPDGVGQ